MDGSCKDSSGALGSRLGDRGSEEAGEFSWEVCFGSVGISGQGASALVKGSGERQREDAAALGGVSRDPGVHWAPLVRGAPDAGIPHVWVLVSHQRELGRVL